MVCIYQYDEFIYILAGELVLTGADEGVEALRAYLVNLAWDAHEAQDGAAGTESTH